jgi:glycine/D-amino acid oxidase-like deaminating enzyme
LYGHIPNYIQREGLAAGAELAEFELAHVQALRDVIVKEQIDCDFVLHRTVDVWCNDDGAAGAKQVYDRMCAHSLSYMRDVFFKHGGEAEALSGVKGAKAMASFTAASLWPYKFITHLLKKMAASGDVNLQTHAPVTRVVPDEKGGFVVETPRGSMHAGRVVHANNAFVAGLLPEYKQSIVPCKGICCRITVPEGTVAPHLPNSYIVRDEDKTLSYLVSRTDGSIVVGGAATRFRPHRSQWYDNIDDRVLPSGGEEYYDGYMQRTFRGWEDSGAQVDQIWTGVMGYSYDSLSHVGEVPGRPQQYIVAGFNGHGMPVIWLAAKGLAQMINEGVEFEKTGVPRVMKTTQARIDRARSGKEEYGDILGDGSLAAEGPKMVSLCCCCCVIWVELCC